MRYLKKFNEMLDPLGSWNPSQLNEEEREEVTHFENGKYYTRMWIDNPGTGYDWVGEKCIFKYKGPTEHHRHPQDYGDYIRVYYSCSNFQPDFFEDGEITISKEGTGKGSIIVEANQKEIDFLEYVRSKWDPNGDDGKGTINVPYEEEKRLFWTKPRVV